MAAGRGARRAGGVLVAALLLGAACPAEIFDGFEGESIDGSRWRPIGLADRDGIVPPPGGRASRAARIAVRPDDVEPPALNLLAEEPRADCEGGPPAVVQRSERRLRDEPAFGEGRWYGFAFRMDGEFEPTGSVRWVIGQWKQSASCWSPFLAQRYDNGVFHVTVEHNDCRVVIAKAPGDPDASPWPRLARAPDERRFFATDADGMLRGEGVEWSPRAGEDCAARVRLDPPVPPPLPSPRDGWVRMAYFVQGGPGGSARIEVWAEGNRVVTAIGHIGDDRGGGREQFKFGIYRNQLRIPSAMLFDSFRRGATRESVDPALCGE